MKHLHLLMVVVTIGLFFYSSVMILSNKPLGKTFQIVSHMVYLAVVASGAYLLWVLTAVAGAQYWAYGKILLLVVAIVLTIKARKNPSTATFGIALVWVSLVGILALAFIKPALLG